MAMQPSKPEDDKREAVAIDEPLLGSRIDWQDVRRELAPGGSGGGEVSDTPEPWMLRQGWHPENWFVVAGDYADQGEPDLLVEVFGTKNDARLIAAAPDLYEALRWLVHLHHGISKGGGKPSDAEWQDAIEAGKAALVKAEGREVGEKTGQ